MNPQDFLPNDRVLYVPGHVAAIPRWEHANHPDSEWGTVSSANAVCVFVRFDRQLAKFGWDGTTAEACDRTNLLWSHRGEDAMTPLGLDLQLRRLGWSHVPVPPNDKHRSGVRAVYNETRTFVGFYDAFELWLLLKMSGRIGMVVAP